MSDAFPGDPAFASRRNAVRDAVRVVDLLEMSHEALACALLVRLWQEYDAAGMSYGRSLDARFL